MTDREAHVRFLLDGLTLDEALALLDRPSYKTKAATPKAMHPGRYRVAGTDLAYPLDVVFNMVRS